ncbi:holin [Prescottella equi]|uniref:Uncharacterized protein n=1 Tax=Prescottella equi ATCC 33707 TaxID=525370 RepID=E9T063_RHOHA|nr:holin [Prescottella equi]EGD24646.1 hypothetical protein HMPREF0724_11764 [Prescottella equi ATCC 33707]
MTTSDASTPVGVEVVGAHSIDSRAFWLDLTDRTVRTFLQNVLVFLGVGTTILEVSWTTALSSATLAALVSFLLALSTATAISSGNFLIDLADRVGRTFVGALVGAIPATGTLSDIDWNAALSIAATTAVVSAITSVLSINLGSVKGVPSLAPVRPELLMQDTTSNSGIEVTLAADADTEQALSAAKAQLRRLGVDYEG